MLKESEKPGLWGEIYAARVLRKSGYEIYSANYRCRFGEIDIIAADENYIAFVEVKTRSAGAIASAGESVDSAKQERLVKTAALYLQNNPVELQPRFDVVEVYLNGEHKPERINHIKNAFDSSM